MKKLAFANRIVFQFVICTTKLGICVFYLRLFPDRGSRRFLYALFAIVAALALAMEFTIIFSCSPISDAWSLGTRNCIQFAPTFIANTCCNIAIDLALMAFVIPKMIPLNLPRSQKIYIYSVVSIGFLVIISAILRLISILRYNKSSDLSWERVNIGIWLSIEVSTGLFCASAPCLKPLICNFFPSLTSTRSDSLSKPPTSPDSGEIKTTRSRRQSMQSHKSAFLPHLKKALSKKAKVGLEEVKLKTIKAKRYSRGTFAYAIRKRDDAFQECDWEDLGGGASVENWLGRCEDEEAVRRAAAMVALSDGEREFARIGRRMSGVSSVLTSG
ncbi:hypothetical protein BKA65DRAFT_79297 [Rhexocercosporidium sp. MPI-PUGE-AT-0058]|nr:hypothetical protein BKA65DRAFT_79297 [Rhexocercosporidium sp. MPI-PUGE-AT-0058]